jgi:hypothetical protein
VLGVVSSRAPHGILQTSTSRKFLPFCPSQQKFVSFFFLRSHNSLTYIHTSFFVLFFLRLSSTPPSLAISLLAPSTLFRATVQIDACALLTTYAYVYTPCDVNFVSRVVRICSILRKKVNWELVVNRKMIFIFLRSVGVVRSRTQATKFSFFISYSAEQNFNLQLPHILKPQTKDSLHIVQFSCIVASCCTRLTFINIK